MDVPPNPAEAALQRLVERLHRRRRLRVWSLVITIFGDAVVPRGGRVALGILREIVGRLGVEPGALRTALSRLAGDHWVIRERDGRNSFYRLAEDGRHSFDLATRRIYSAGPPEWDGTWTVAIAPPGVGTDAAALAEAGFVKAEGGVYLRPETAGAVPAPRELSGMLVIHGTSAEHPETLRVLWPSAEVADAYRGFMDAVKPLALALKGGGGLPPLAAMAARTLLIHDWRRIVLRDPGLPEALLPGDWPGEDARGLVRALYRVLLPPSEAWLDRAGLPTAVDPASFSARFGRDREREAGNRVTKY
jgi:phenylacetic acid degradation operon negative regulatory protein